MWTLLVRNAAGLRFRSGNNCKNFNLPPALGPRATLKPRALVLLLEVGGISSLHQVWGSSENLYKVHRGLRLPVYTSVLCKHNLFLIIEITVAKTTGRQT